MIVRTQELKTLEESFGQSGNQLIVLYGREGCQKEQLLSLFAKEKKVFFYRCRQASEQEQLEMMQTELEEMMDVKFQSTDYHTFFNRLKSRDGSKLVLIFDEFQNIARKDESFLKNILLLKSKKLYPGPVQIILSSSSVSWIRGEFREQLPNFAKMVNLEMELEDLKFIDVVRSFPDYSVSQCVQVYGVIGGVPAYVERWDRKRDIRYNICKNVLSRDGYLFLEAEKFIASQLRELANYDTILSAIAAGNRKLNDLYRKTGFSRAKISVYMKNLMAFDVIEKVNSFETGGWENTQKGIYQIKNTYINFWFKFVYPNLSKLYMLSPEEFYDQFIAEELEEYLNRYFCQVCMEYLELLNTIHKLPVEIHKMGTWVGKQGNIDIIAQDTARVSIVGICNWSEEEMPYEVCEQLDKSMEKAHIASDYRYLFSAKAFQQKLVDKAKEDKRYILVDMKEL